MTAQTKNRTGFWQDLFRRDGRGTPEEMPAVADAPQQAAPELDIAPNDPILAYLASVSGVVEVEKLDLDSPALKEMRQAGVKLLVPLVSQGELIKLLNLGPRLSQQEYSDDDRKLLSDLATQTAPAVRVAQLVRQQQEAKERERIEQELRVASLIQQTLLPKTLPELPGYDVAAYYQPAREVGGDFYDFLDLEDGRFGLVVGDVTDKGVPAALVMATTRTMLRAAAQRLLSPGEVLQRVNDVLVQDIPPNMFVTCLYAILDTESGRLVYANAGHDLPYRWRAGRSDGAEELRARGCRSGSCPAWATRRRRSCWRRARACCSTATGSSRRTTRAARCSASRGFRASSGPALWWLLPYKLPPLGAPALYRRELGAGGRHHAGHPRQTGGAVTAPRNEAYRTLAELSVPSEPGNERRAMEEVAGTVEGLGLPDRALERLKTAVAEATMNAMEHGNRYMAEVPVLIEVAASDADLSVRITDEGGGPPAFDSETPDLAAKLDEAQTPRGWGLFSSRARSTR